jgi:hypothetical protein
LKDFILNSFKKHKEFRPLYEKLFINRNVEMANKILKYLKDDKNYFVVVGSGHLVGEKNILYLVKEQGYKTNQL